MSALVECLTGLRPIGCTERALHYGNREFELWGIPAMPDQQASSQAAPPPRRLFRDVQLRDANDLGALARLAWHDGTSSATVRRFVFRGQNAAYPLLEPRADRDHAIPQDVRRWIAMGSSDREDMSAVLQAYKRIVPSTGVRLPQDDDWLEWMALIQHFGGPTRLLDFSDSPLVALYFASTNADSKLGSFVWCVRQDFDALQQEFTKHHAFFKRFPRVYDLNPIAPVYAENKVDPKEVIRFSVTKLLEEMDQGVGAGRRVLHYLHDWRDYVDLLGPIPTANEAVLDERKLTGVVIARPFRMNPRLLAQQGCFMLALVHRPEFIVQLVPDQAQREELEQGANLDYCKSLPDLNASIDELVSDPPVIIRVWLPPDVRLQLSTRLRAYNVTGYSLFPDLEGASRAMSDVQQAYRGYQEYRG